MSPESPPRLELLEQAFDRYLGRITDLVDTVMRRHQDKSEAKLPAADRDMVAAGLDSVAESQPSPE